MPQLNRILSTSCGGFCRSIPGRPSSLWPVRAGNGPSDGLRRQSTSLLAVAACSNAHLPSMPTKNLTASWKVW
jgi:hypothetical protein